MLYATLMTTPHVSNVELIAQITQQYRIARNADKQPHGAFQLRLNNYNSRTNIAK